MDTKTTKAETMKAVTLWEPWATLILIGAKRVETRSWATSYRGPIAIHAAARFKEECRALAIQEPFAGVLMEGLGLCHISEIAPRLAAHRGHIIAVAEIYDVLPTYAPEHPPLARADRWMDGLTPQERAFGNYEPRRYGWLLKDVRPIDPVPVRGRQLLWEWNETGPPDGVR